MSRTINYKEKYEKALERAREWYNNPNSSSIGKSYLYTVFPELKESSDEMIRKGIISLVNAHGQGRFKESMLTWLEKQCEYNKLLKYIKVGDIITKSPDGILINLGHSDRALEHSDKVEPKFKVGDWIVTDKNHIWLIDEDCSTTGYSYRLISQNGKVEIRDYNIVDEHAHLWTIQDAKEGDILANDRVICVYKERVSEHVIKVTINYSRREDIETHYDTIGDFDLYPATKAQRDFFISKILQK